MLSESEFSAFRPLVHGAAEIRNTEDGVLCLRFTEAQTHVYDGNPDFHEKTFATAGIRLEFTTDARSFELDYRIFRGSSRMFYYFDVEVNGILVQHDGAESYAEVPEGTLRVPLDGAVNRVTVWFPCLTAAVITGFRFEGAGRIEPVAHRRTIICCGDSITQGYDAFFPSLTYPNQLAAAFDADILNKAIGGEYFNAALAEHPDAVAPDCVTVAYGTNDWSRQPRADFEENARGFFAGLAKMYPGVPVFAILPLWRKDCGRVTDVGTFAEASDFLRGVCGEYADVRVIEGGRLTPHVEEVYSDRCLHPNDVGFQFMGGNLIRILGKEL